MFMQISGVDVGPEYPCRMVCEISNNHNGDLVNAIRLIHECAEAGADFVKFQCYTPQELVDLRGDGPAPDPWGSWTMKDLYEKAQTPHAWFPRLTEVCEEVGIPWFSSVFGPESLALLQSLDCPAYKIASLDRLKWPLMQSVLATGKSVIRSTPEMGSPFTEALAGVLSLYCPEGYPQEEFDFTSFRWADGFSYHGTSVQPLMEAVESGADMLEAHVQLAHVPSELESNVSITTDQVRELTKWMKDLH